MSDVAWVLLALVGIAAVEYAVLSRLIERKEHGR